ncbi:hypothetical protein PT2222_80278 [Paraburkholderia tropica]
MPAIRPSACSPAANAAHVDIEDHRGQNRGAQDDVERERVDADEREAVVQNAEHRRADQAAHDRARAARERCAADHGRRHGEEHDLVAARLRIDRGDAKAFEDAREAREHGGQHEVAEPQPVHADAGLARADGIRARRLRMQTPARVPQQHVHDEGERDRPEDFAVAPRAHEVREPGRPRRGGGRAARHGQRDAVNEEQRAERGDERGQAQPHRHRAVHEADHGGGHEPGDHGEPHGRTRVVREHHHERREREHHARREIDVAADHQHDFAERDDRHWRDELREVDEARVGEQEVVVREFEPGGQQHGHEQDAQLGRPVRCERNPRAFRRAGGIRLARFVHRIHHDLIAPLIGTICGLVVLPS